MKQHIMKFDEMMNHGLTEGFEINQSISTADKIVKILQLMHNSDFRITKGFSEIESIKVSNGGYKYLFTCGETAQDGSDLMLSCNGSAYEKFSEYGSDIQNDAYIALCLMVTKKLSEIIDGLTLEM